MDYKSFALQGFETKSSDDGVATFTAVASHSDIDLHNDIIEPGAFGSNLKNIPMLRDHHGDQIGGWSSFEQEGDKLKGEGAILLKDVNGAPRPLAVDTYSLMKGGFLTGVSVGFKPKAGGVVWDDEKNVRRIKKAILLEVSIVTIPAQPKARVRQVKSMTSEGYREWLGDCGFDDDEIKIVMTKGLDALLTREVEIPRFLREQRSEDEELSMLAIEMRGLLEAVKTEGHQHV